MYVKHQNVKLMKLMSLKRQLQELGFHSCGGMALMNIYVNFIDSLIKVSSQDCKQTAFVFLLSKKYLYEVVDLLIDSD